MACPDKIAPADAMPKAGMKDSEFTWIESYPYARLLAEAMGARCIRLEELKADRVVQFITG